MLAGRGRGEVGGRREPGPAGAAAGGGRGLQGQRPWGAAGAGGKADAPARGPRPAGGHGHGGGSRPAADSPCCSRGAARSRCQHREGAGACAEPGPPGAAASAASGAAPRSRAMGAGAAAPQHPRPPARAVSRCCSSQLQLCARQGPAPPLAPRKMASPSPSPGSELPPHHAARLRDVTCPAAVGRGGPGARGGAGGARLGDGDAVPARRRGQPGGGEGALLGRPRGGTGRKGA